MNTFLFTWNPSKWPWTDLTEAVYEANAEGCYRDSWSCGATRQIKPGDRAFLIRLGIQPKGLIGSGVVASEPYQKIHWNAERARQGDTAYSVDIIFDLLSENPILGETDLQSGKLATHNWFPQASGTHIPQPIANELESLWTQKTGSKFTPLAEDDLYSLRFEGKKRNTQTTIYERSPDAREACIHYYGVTCQVCHLKFDERYGDIGKGFIHVHHIIPIADIGVEYQVDAVKDLRPVCPNCHAMLHKKTPPFSIEELKKIIK